ncbi:MAG: T9SS type A sorting domain-containing protein [Bacteroidota bacterium]
MRLIIIYTALVAIGLACPQKSPANNTGISVDTLTNLIDANVAPFNQLHPGDTVLFEPGRHDFILIRNFTGAAGMPIIFMNKNGIVTIDTDHYFGISIQNCRFIRLTGSGNETNFYGFKITRVQNGAGIGVNDMSSDFEIDHISIENSPIGGIYAKTDPDCSFQSTRDKFTQYNTVIHDNYIANVGNEGLYIGSTKYSGQTVTCNGKDTLLLPSLLQGVRIFNNIIRYTGWDGIQVSSASSDCNVFNNQILYDSQAEYSGQMSGIILGGGSKCDCFNNYISQGKGDGIESHGLGGNRIFNNIIVDAGRTFLPMDNSQMKHGIFVSDVSAINDSSFYILFNDIINPKSDGIRFQSIKSKNNLIVSNLIINPGNFEFYQNGNTSFRGEDAYIMLPNAASDVNIKNNFLSLNIFSARISTTDYAILPGSPLINGAFSNSMGINFDFANNPRPSGNSIDIGALEFDPGQIGIDSNIDNPMKPVLFPNPVHSLLTIKYHIDAPSCTELYVYNLYGTLIFQKQQDAVTFSEQEIQIEVGNLTAGIYIYKIQAGNEIEYGKFIKVE